MAFGINVVTNNAAALTSKLEAHGIHCIFWNPEACLSNREVEAQLGFASKQDQMAARNILGLAAA
jgi:hypothetical protein